MIEDRIYVSGMKTIRAAIIQNAKAEAEKIANDLELLKNQDPEDYIRNKANQIAKNAFIQFEKELKEKFSDPLYEFCISGSLSAQKIDFYMTLPSELKRMMRKKFEEAKIIPKSDSQISSKEQIPNSSELESPKTSSKETTSSSSEFEESPKIKSDSKDPPKKGDTPPSGWIKI